MTSGQWGHRFFTAALPPIWSLWPCVIQNGRRRQSLLFQVADDLLRLQAGVDDHAVGAVRSWAT